MGKYVIFVYYFDFLTVRCGKKHVSCLSAAQNAAFPLPAAESINFFKLFHEKGKIPGLLHSPKLQSASAEGVFPQGLPRFFLKIGPGTSPIHGILLVKGEKIVWQY